MRFPVRHKGLQAGVTNPCRLELIVGNTGRIVERRFCSGYLSVSKPLYPEGDLPHFILINTSGGLVQGDRLSLDVQVKAGCKAHLTTQSANRIYRMEDGCAVQELNLSVGEKAFLEYLPDQNIPFRGSNFVQLTTVDLRRSSVFFGWEVVHPGRYTRGERFEMGLYHSGLEVRIDGRPALMDTVVLEPGKLRQDSPGILGGASFTGTIYAYCENAGGLKEALGVPCCITPAGVLVARLTGSDWLSMQRQMAEAHRAFRVQQGLLPLAARRC